MAVASLVLGIIAIVFGLIGLGFPIGALCGVIGIILAVVAKNNPEKAGMAKAGMVCSIIGLILSLLLFIACAACIGSAGVLGALS